MKKFFITLLAIGLLLNSCDPSNKDNSALPFNVNLERDFKNVSSIPLSTLGSKLEYVALETDSACLIQTISNAFISDSFIFVSDYNRLLLFGRDGKYLRQIGSKGRGPGEYSSIGNFIVENSKREVYVLSSRVVLVYSFNGNFIRDFKIDFPSRQFVLNESGEFVLHPFNLPQPTTDTVYSWYIVDKFGSVQTKIKNTLKRVNGGIIIPNSPIYMYNGTPHFMEFGIDTLYNYKNNVKIPYAIFYSGSLKLPPDPTMAEVPNINGKIWISDVRETKKSLLIKVWGGLSGPISNCIFDKSSSTFTVLKDNGYFNDIDGGVTFWPETIINDNLMIDFADAFDLITFSKNKELENNTIDGQLADVIENLTETSNPVIMILEK